MKIRTDYVTNSSSSSFILAFDNDRDYRDFCESCEWLDYEQLGDMVKNSILETSQPEQKDNAREFLQRYFERTKYVDTILAEHFEDYHKDKSAEQYAKIWDFEKSKEYADRLKQLLDNDKDYQEKLKRINEAKIVVKMMIWDTNGGILEWAIRNGFLESEYWRNLILRWNVG